MDEGDHRTMPRFHLFSGLAALFGGLLLFSTAPAAPKRTAHSTTAARPRLQKRWLFIWRDMSDPKEVDRMIARFPRAEADGYNGVAFSYNVAKAKTAALRQAAQQHHLDLIAIVMGGAH